MPEGPEIKRAADQIARAIARQPIVEIFFAFDHLKPYALELSQHQIDRIESRGKAMLIRFAHGMTIYSHNQLYGKWMVRAAQSFPTTNRQLRLAIHTPKKSALLYSASDIEVLNDADLPQHPFLKRLGLDVLSDSTTVDQVHQRFQDSKFQRRRFTSLLLDQHFLCGLGNYLRSELMFVGRVNPTLRPIDYQPHGLLRLAEATIALPQQSYLTGGITNDLDHVAALKADGWPRSQYRHWVFNRDGKPCFVCGAPIIKDATGGRRYYYCPSCQAV